MRPSMFNLRVPVRAGEEVFLMNTLTDAQLVVSPDVAGLLDRAALGPFAASTEDERDAIDILRQHGFLVADRAADLRALESYFSDIRSDASQLHVTVLTTLQCNFACDYCFQGDHGDYNLHAERMSLDTAARVVDWIEHEIDRVRPRSFRLTFFGGEPLLNLPVMYALAEQTWAVTQARGIRQTMNIITNGLLLTPAVVDRLTPYGLTDVKITLDGDRDVHDRMRPLRGGQGTFDRIVENVRQVADKIKIAVGGNFDESSVDSYPALLDFLKELSFSDKLAKVAFKPIVRTAKPAQPVMPKGALPLIPVTAGGKPLNGSCMTAAGAGNTPCDSCGFADDKMSFLREETKRRGFPTVDGVHMGPCQIHRDHSHTIGPDGSLYACPGFTGEMAQSTGHIDGRADALRDRVRDKFAHLGAWKNCGDCAFIPVCAGGCSTASHTELGDIDTPTCHKPSFESALLTLAEEMASRHLGELQ